MRKNYTENNNLEFLEICSKNELQSIRNFENEVFTRSTEKSGNLINKKALKFSSDEKDQKLRYYRKWHQNQI